MRPAALLLALLLAPAMAAAQPSPLLLLRVTISPQGPVWIGQRVTVTMTAMTAVRFAAPPRFPDLAPRGRAVVLPEASTIPGTERLGGESFAALQHSIDLFPSEAGDLPLPGVRLQARVGGADGRPVEATATAPELRIPVRPAPSGVADLSRLAVAPVLRLTASTDRAPEELHVGEAITRTVRMEAEDTAAMLLPPVLWGNPEGVSIYPAPPSLEDRTDRGVLRASRVERAAYVPQRSGPVELPGFSLFWLDPRNGEVQELRVEPIRFDALPPTQQAARPRRPGPWIATGAAVAFLAGTAFLAWRRRLFRRAADPEREALAALTAACRAGDAKGAMAALFHWSDLVLPQSGERGLACLAALACSPALAAEAGALERHLYGGGAPVAWNPGNLLKAVRRARRHLRRPGEQRRYRLAALPELNPVGQRPPPTPRVVLRHWAR
jgi:hypothetical protein